jgi:bifunctional non-homologous end joining protein LigD
VFVGRLLDVFRVYDCLGLSKKLHHQSEMCDSPTTDFVLLPHSNRINYAGDDATLPVGQAYSGGPIKFTEWTNDNQLRQPVFLGLRTDKESKDVVRQ